jgi:hypothetical protein
MTTTNLIDATQCNIKLANYYTAPTPTFAVSYSYCSTWAKKEIIVSVSDNNCFDDVYTYTADAIGIVTVLSLFTVDASSTYI